MDLHASSSLSERVLADVIHKLHTSAVPLPLQRRSLINRWLENDFRGVGVGVGVRTSHEMDWVTFEWIDSG